MEKSILMHIRSLLGIPEDYDGYDPAVLTAINNAIFTLAQIGLDVPADFVVTSNEETWTNLVGDAIIEPVKSYIYFKVRLEFDPPSTLFLLTSMNSQIEELVSRIFLHLDSS